LNLLINVYHYSKKITETVADIKPAGKKQKQTSNLRAMKHDDVYTQQARSGRPSFGLWSKFISTSEHGGLRVFTDTKTQTCAHRQIAVDRY